MGIFPTDDPEFQEEYAKACTEIDSDQPTNSFECRCGRMLHRWRGQYGVFCGDCGREYNPSGQLLRSDWRGNPSNWDEDVSDLDGYEMQYAGDE